jgi:hypothetical protein
VTKFDLVHEKEEVEDIAIESQQWKYPLIIPLFTDPSWVDPRPCKNIVGYTES